MNQQSPGRKSSLGPANTGGTNSNAGASSAQSHFEEAHALLTQIVADPAFAASVIPFPPFDPITNSIDLFHEIEKQSFAGYAQVNVLCRQLR